MFCSQGHARSPALQVLTTVTKLDFTPERRAFLDKKLCPSDSCKRCVFVSCLYLLSQNISVTYIYISLVSTAAFKTSKFIMIPAIWKLCNLIGILLYSVYSVLREYSVPYMHMMFLCLYLHQSFILTTERFHSICARVYLLLDRNSSFLWTYRHCMCMC